MNHETGDGESAVRSMVPDPHRELSVTVGDGVVFTVTLTSTLELGQILPASI